MENFFMTPKFWSRFMKIEYFLFSVALPGAERREGAQHTKVSFHMTRRAFLDLRVIRLQWESC